MPTSVQINDRGAIRLAILGHKIMRMHRHMRTDIPENIRASDLTDPYKKSIQGFVFYNLQFTLSQTTKEVIRYLVAGTIAFLVDLSTLVGLTELLQINYLVANICGFCLAVSVSYVLCTNWVFETRRLQCVVSEFGIFAGVALLGLLVNELSMWALVDGGNIHYALAKVVATGVVFMLNFILRKIFLFR